MNPKTSISEHASLNLRTHLTRVAIIFTVRMGQKSGIVQLHEMTRNEMEIQKEMNKINMLKRKLHKKIFKIQISGVNEWKN